MSFENQSCTNDLTEDTVLPCTTGC